MEGEYTKEETESLLKSERNENRLLSEKIQRLGEKIQSLEAENTALKGEIRQLRETLSRRNQEIGDARAARKKAQETAGRYRGTLKQMAKLLEQAKVG